MVAKAYVPAQNARGGVLRLKVVVGQYGEIRLKNESLVRDSFLQGVIDHARARSAYVEKTALERAMSLGGSLGPYALQAANRSIPSIFGPSCASKIAEPTVPKM